VRNIRFFRGGRSALIPIAGITCATWLGACLEEDDGEARGGTTASGPGGTSQIRLAEDECCCDDTECQDGLFCNGRERCDCWGVCLPSDPTFNLCFDADPCTSDFCDEGRDLCPHEWLEGPGCPCRRDSWCEDGDRCTVDRCDTAAGVCSHDAVSCGDGDRCTSDACDRAAGCVHHPVSCDDGRDCTIDACDRQRGCLHTTVGFCPPLGREPPRRGLPLRPRFGRP